MIEIKDRYTDRTLQIARAYRMLRTDLSGVNLQGANLRGVNLQGANLRRACLTDANLYTANLSCAHLREADLRKADLTGANLTGADLYGAYLSGANLSGANLNGADLTGANLTGATIIGDRLNGLLVRATRLDGYEFFLFALEGGSTKIKAGCRWMSVADYRAHVARDYPDTDKARETLRILDFFEATAEMGK